MPNRWKQDRPSLHMRLSKHSLEAIDAANRHIPVNSIQRFCKSLEEVQSHSSASSNKIFSSSTWKIGENKLRSDLVDKKQAVGADQPFINENHSDMVQNVDQSQNHISQKKESNLNIDSPDPTSRNNNLTTHGDNKPLRKLSQTTSEKLSVAIAHKGKISQRNSLTSACVQEGSNKCQEEYDTPFSKDVSQISLALRNSLHINHSVTVTPDDCISENDQYESFYKNAQLNVSMDTHESFEERSNAANQQRCNQPIGYQFPLSCRKDEVDSHEMLSNGLEQCRNPFSLPKDSTPPQVDIEDQNHVVQSNFTKKTNKINLNDVNQQYFQCTLPLRYYTAVDNTYIKGNKSSLRLKRLLEQRNRQGSKHSQLGPSEDALVKLRLNRKIKVCIF